jgi:catechol 2,3-dioxygenase-like lactoylglutathione lyase family enzyme
MHSLKNSQPAALEMGCFFMQLRPFAVGCDHIRHGRRGKGPRRQEHARAFPVITGLDHVVVLTGDIRRALPPTRRCSRAPSWRNSGDGAERVLFTLDNMTLELMAPSGDGEAADRIRSVLAAQGEGLASLCFRTNDIAKMHRRLDRLTLKPEPVAEVESRDAITAPRCRGSAPAPQPTPRAASAVLPRTGKGAPAVGANRAGLDHGDGSCRGLDAGPRTGRRALWRAARARHGARPLASRLGPADVLPLRRPHRRGHAPAGQAADGTQDRLRGICWRVADIDATHARLTAAGVDVSEVRTGRKPGTRVMTVRNGTCGVPTLLVQPSVKGP